MAQRRYIWRERFMRIKRAWCGLWLDHPMAYNDARVNDPLIVNMRCPRCDHQWLRARTKGL